MIFTIRKSDTIDGDRGILHYWWIRCCYYNVHTLKGDM
jgi:hypothetical protein